MQSTTKKTRFGKHIHDHNRPLEVRRVRSRVTIIVMGPTVVVVGVSVVVERVGGGTFLHGVRRGLHEAAGAGLGLDGRCEIDVEGDGVKGEDEGDDPLEDGADVGQVAEGGGGKCDGEAELDDDEGELHPEGHSKNTEVTVVWGGY